MPRNYIYDEGLAQLYVLVDEQAAIVTLSGGRNGLSALAEHFHVWANCEEEYEDEHWDNIRSQHFALSLILNNKPPSNAGSLAPMAENGAQIAQPTIEIDVRNEPSITYVLQEQGLMLELRKDREVFVVANSPACAILCGFIEGVLRCTDEDARTFIDSKDILVEGSPKLAITFDSVLDQ